VAKTNGQEVWSFAVSSAHIWIGAVLEEELGGDGIAVPHCQGVQWTVVVCIVPVGVYAPFDQQFPDAHIEILIRWVHGCVEVFRGNRPICSWFWEPASSPGGDCRHSAIDLGYRFRILKQIR